MIVGACITKGGEKRAINIGDWLEVRLERTTLEDGKELIILRLDGYRNLVVDPSNHKHLHLTCHQYILIGDVTPVLQVSSEKFNVIEVDPIFINFLILYIKILHILETVLYICKLSEAVRG